MFGGFLRIFGIDPGLKVLGFGVLNVKDEIVFEDCGTLQLPKSIIGNDRFAWYDQELRKLFENYRPDVVALEKIFLGKNVDSAFKLGHLRGICLAVATAYKANIHEYAARLVKKGVTGSGAAEKEQVRMVLKAILGIKTNPALDASDAIALAYFHAITFQVNSRLKIRMKEANS